MNILEGLLGVQYIIPISTAIITLLVIVYFSYRQTIEAYPAGGGSYTVARFNLGAPASLLAAAALLADYILTAAVGISAGVARRACSSPCRRICLSAPFSLRLRSAFSACF